MSEKPTHKPTNPRPVEFDVKGRGHSGEGFHGRGREGRHKNLESEPHASVEEWLRDSESKTVCTEPLEGSPSDFPELRQEYEEYAETLPSVHPEALSREGREIEEGENFRHKGRDDTDAPKFRGQKALVRKIHRKKVSANVKEKAMQKLEEMKRDHSRRSIE
ncbi:hypothetical protein GEMRC1_011390 [Eukaryota sp. GEM-RC1]